MNFNSYTLKARYFPSLIILVPFSIFLYQILTASEIEILKDRLLLEIFTGVSLNLILLYFLSSCVRFIGKFIIERRMYSNELDFPSTKFLLYSDSSLSSPYKRKIREKLVEDFGLIMPNKKEEEIDINAAKVQASEAVSLIRNKVGNGKLLLQHNIEYGFARNLIAGLIIAIPMCIVNFFYISYDKVFYLNTGILIVFIIISFFSKLILKNLSELYAKRLFIEYLA